MGSNDHLPIADPVDRLDVLYQLASYNGEEPDWKLAYRQAYERCQELERQLEAAESIEDRIFGLMEKMNPTLGQMELQFASNTRDASFVTLWLSDKAKHYFGATIDKAVADAIAAHSPLLDEPAKEPV